MNMTTWLLAIILNDKDMLQNAKLAIAMENGDPALFTYADFICGPSYQDSIEKALKTIPIHLNFYTENVIFVIQLT